MNVSSFIKTYLLLSYSVPGTELGASYSVVNKTSVVVVVKVEKRGKATTLKGAAFTLLRRRQLGSERTRSGGPQESGAEGSQGRRDGATSQP